MIRPKNFYDLPKGLQNVVRFDAYTPSETYMQEVYERLSDEELLKKAKKLRDKRAKQLEKIVAFIEKK